MHRFYSEAPVHPGETCVLGEEAAHHVRNVLRLRAGEDIAVFDGRDGAFAGPLLRVDRQQVSLRPERRVQEHLPPEDLTLWFSPLKKDACAFLVQKATELGAGVLRPVRMQRTSVPGFPVDKRRLTAIGAAEQCRLTAVPQVHEATEFVDMCAALHNESVLFCDETGGEPAAAALQRTQGTLPVRHVVIGPEGGFTPQERSALRALPSALPVSLGPRILRAETAAAAALTLVIALRH